MLLTGYHQFQYDCIQNALVDDPELLQSSSLLNSVLTAFDISTASSMIMVAAFSPIIVIAACVLPPTRRGIALPSATLSPWWKINAIDNIDFHASMSLGKIRELQYQHKYLNSVHSESGVKDLSKGCCANRVVNCI